MNSVYIVRQAAASFRDIDFKIVGPSTIVFYLTHLYAYLLPVKMGDCFNALGQYLKAEEYYILASKYSFLNKQVEATALWIRMARNVINWGDSLYKDEDLPQAKIQYTKLITEDGHVPGSYLYNTDALVVPADQARTLIQNILARPIPAANWEIAIAVLTASAQLQQILDGLDFYGLMLSPIHTFEYLQSVARGFAQEAIQAEREFVNFKSHQEMEAATRRDLTTAVAMSQAEANGRFQQYIAALDDQAATEIATQLATKRRDDAQTQRDKYVATSAAQVWAQAASAALSGGQDAMWKEISELADQLARGEKSTGKDQSLPRLRSFMLVARRVITSSTRCKIPSMS